MERWTKEETSKLIKLRNEGKTYEQIAKILGRTYYSCGDKLYILKQEGVQFIDYFIVKCSNCGKECKTKKNKENSYCSVECKNENYYKKNKKNIISRVKRIQKDNNYSYEKTPNQRKLRYIKRRTRFLYPIEKQKCKFCDEMVTERHHYTIPIEIDKFWFVCHKHHLECDSQKRNTGIIPLINRIERRLKKKI